MLGFTKTIFYLTRKEITVIQVNIKPSLKVKQKFRAVWQPETLSDVLIDLKKNLNVSLARIVLADELAYLVKLTIPVATTIEEERDIVFAKMEEQVPEILENDEWDFKVVALDNDQKELIAFAPVKQIFLIIKKAFSIANIKVEAIEPELIAKMRDKNPLIGLALKNDLEGKDEEVLNVKLDNEYGSKDNQQDENNKKTNNLILMISTIVAGALVALLIVYFFVMPLKMTTSSQTTTPLQVTSPLPSASSPTALDLSKYNVRIENGSGVAGEASVVSTILKAEGFTQIIVANAASYDSLITTVQYKLNLPESVVLEIERALNGEYEIRIIENQLTETSKYDVLITVGKKINDR